MSLFFSALPIVAVIVALLAGVRSLHAALVGVSLAAVGVAVAFPVAGDVAVPALRLWLPVLIEVLLIVGGGLLLSEVLRVAGAQKALAQWMLAHAGSGVSAVLLIVHGVTPFAESLTGFGIGVTIGIPLLAHCGLSARKVALIGLLGLCAVPWGSMGPGTLIAATMAGLSLQSLGVASAMVSVIPFVVTGVAAAWLASAPGERASAVLRGAVSGMVLTLAVGGANLVAGTAPAGALGALAVIVLYLGVGRWRRSSADTGRVRAVTLDGQARRALMAYAVLLLGVLLMGRVVRALELPAVWHMLASPGLWLFVAAFFFARGSVPAQALARTVQAWRQVAPVTALFIVLGVLMAVSGMATQLAHTLAGAGASYLFAAPFVGALGGFVTGSNTGANAMFAATQAEIAHALSVPLLPFMAVHNVSAALLLMASPGKVEMACQLAPAEAIQHRRWVQVAVLAVDGVAVALMALLNVVLGVLAR